MSDSALSRAELVKFHLQAALACVGECDKQYVTAMNISLLLIASASLVTFSEISEDKISVPSLGFALPQAHAAEVLLILASASFLRAMALASHMFMVRLKVRQILLKEGDSSYPWYVGFPSPYVFFSVFSHVSGWTKIISRSFNMTVNFLVLLGPIFLWLKLGAMTSYNLHWAISFCLGLLLLLTGFLIRENFPYDEPEISAVISRLEAKLQDGIKLKEKNVA